MKRGVALLVLAVLSTVTVPVTGAATAAQNDAPPVYISVDDVTLSPETPVPGEPVTITTTVENLAASAELFEVEAVILRRAGGGSLDNPSRVTGLGTLRPGTAIDVPLTTSFGRTGTKRLRVHVVGETKSGQNRHIEYPVVVTVSDSHPQVRLSVNDTAAGATGLGTVTVANGLSTTARNVAVTFESDAVTVHDEPLVISSLESGERASETFEFESDTVGIHSLEATVRYAVQGASSRTVSTSTNVEIERLQSSVSLDASQRTDGSGPTIAVDVVNQGNAPLTDVTVGGTSANASVSQRFVDRIPARSIRTVTLNVTVPGGRATVTATATFDVAGRSRRASDEVVVSSTAGQITLTGVSTQRDGDRLHVTGSASNVGLGPADSVIVSVIDTARVTPAAPSREYFVGTVPESDFASFDVYARTSGNVSAIPLKVSYRSRGERFTRRTSVAVNPGASADPAPADGRSSGGLIGTLVPVLTVLAVGVVGVKIWRRSRGGT